MMIGIFMVGFVMVVINVWFLMKSVFLFIEWLLEYIKVIVGMGIFVYMVFFVFGVVWLMLEFVFVFGLWVILLVMGFVLIFYYWY